MTEDQPTYTVFDGAGRERELTDEQMEALVAEAEAGYPVGPCEEHLGGTTYCGRPALALQAGAAIKFLCTQHRKGYEWRTS